LLQDEVPHAELVLDLIDNAAWSSEHDHPA